jgi:glycosyltransferase involved in cell wall biosynthesis
MIIKSEKLLSSREVITGSKYVSAEKTGSFTVFLGIYNAMPFLAKLLEDLEAQTVENFPLIIVDNHSTDGSWNEIQSWPEGIRSRAKLIRNPINLGGIGSLALNSTEVESDWFITLHQDDNYMSNHLDLLSSGISQAQEGDIVVFSDMGTQDFDGIKRATTIRQSWIADLTNTHSAFRANLLQQTVTWPSAAFRKDAFVSITFPWHSSTFNDAEITLLQSPKGKFKFIPQQTMLYRMNPQSESHDLNPREIVLGPFAALCRVMASDSFFTLCAELAESDRSNFAKAVLEGIEIRLGESPFSEIVKMVASETMGMAWDYSETISREQLIQTYKLADAGRTTKLLGELGAFYSNSESSTDQLRASKLTDAQAELVRLLDQATPTSNAQGRKAQKAVLALISKILPLQIRRKVVALIVGIYVIFNPKSPWSLSWKLKH